MESAQDLREANVFRLAAADKEILMQLAISYIWWKPPEEDRVSTNGYGPGDEIRRLRRCKKTEKNS